MKLLTVTVPCYNSQDYMEKCIDSLLIGGERVEIIIIDDGSTDRTGEIADRYAESYPSMVRVVHQENGGHGEGINQGLARATGTYFKTVDSDDWLLDFPRFLDTLEAVDRRGGVDLFITNYYYEHADGKGNRSINFSNALPQDRVFTWGETRPFRIDQILMIHACTFRTALLRQTGLQMPKHTFYEDNYMVYGNLRSAQKMYYMNLDLYRYFIGRGGQSVQADVMTRHYAHQLKVTELCFTCLAISVLCARLSGTAQAEQDLAEMWRACRAYDAPWADRFRRQIVLRLASIPGKGGAAFVRALYKVAHRVVRFN